MRFEDREPRAAETNPEGHWSYVQHLIQRLRELEERTRPSGGDATAKDKDWHATDALWLAGELVDALAGWAIDHQVGLALQNLENVPPPIGAEKDYPERIAAVDTHAHEVSGFGAKEANVDHGGARKVLANLLIHNQGALPAWLAQQCLAAIQAIEFGDKKARHLFVTVGKGNRHPLATHEIELQALAFVAFRRAAYGHTEERAAGDVATALIVAPNTLLSWEHRLIAKFGKLEVARRLAEARHAGEHYAEMLSGGPHANEEEEKDLARHRSVIEGQFGAAALKILSERYRVTIRGDA